MKSKLVVLLVLVGLALTVVGCSPPAPEVGATVIVPKVTDMSEAAAKATLAKSGLKVGAVTRTKYPAGSAAFVITQYPAAQSPATPGDAVDLTIAEPATK
jgi:beta-lactam-binding protein with PASTA domain